MNGENICKSKIRKGIEFVRGGGCHECDMFYYHRGIGRCMADLLIGNDEFDAIGEEIGSCCWDYGHYKITNKVLINKMKSYYEQRKEVE